MFCSFQIFMIYLEILYVQQIGQKYMPYLKEYLTIYQALLYTKQNLPVLTITTPNGFKIGSSTTEIRGVSKVSLTMNNPVVPPSPKAHAHVSKIFAPPPFPFQLFYLFHEFALFVASIAIQTEARPIPCG